MTRNMKDIKNLLKLSSTMPAGTAQSGGSAYNFGSAHSHGHDHHHHHGAGCGCGHSHKKDDTDN